MSIWFSLFVCMMRCAIWYHLYNLKKRKKRPWRSVTFTLTLLRGCFSRFLNCANGTKSRKAPLMCFLCFLIWFLGCGVPIRLLDLLHQIPPESLGLLTPFFVEYSASWLENVLLTEFFGIIFGCFLKSSLFSVTSFSVDKTFLFSVYLKLWYHCHYLFHWNNKNFRTN